jgi:hydroxymethylbilane synthase
VERCVIVIGSRGSQLALWQARHIAANLADLGAETRIEIIKTTGDRITDVPLAKLGGKGLFTKEIEEALLARTIDVAVHSLKDVPSEIPAGLTLAAIPEREDPRDALIGRPLEELGDGARVGTSSLRRASQLRALGQGITIEMLRGNVDTRLRKLDEGQYDAIVLAAAGLKRLGLQDRIRELLPSAVMCPAVGQGALAIETRDREKDGDAFELARKLDHAESRIAITAERALLAALGGSCQVPVGGYAVVNGKTLYLRAIVASPDGSRVIHGVLRGVLSADSSDDRPMQIGTALAHDLLSRGAREILSAVYAS